MAIEVATGRLVVLAICDGARLAALSAARGLTHRHLASIVDVMRDVPEGAFHERVKVPAGSCVAIAEHVPGRSLRAALNDGPLHAAKAVAWTLRLADAVQALHAVGAVHGAISPRSVLAAPEGRAIAPVLTELVAPPVGAYCPPERLRGAAEAPTDDVWALYATLYAALTGKAPFEAPTREGLLKAMGSRPAPLVEFGVEEPALQEIIARGLVSERRGRSADLAELIAALDGWERDPKMLPPPAPPPRPAPRGLGDIVGGGTALASGRDDGIVIDDSALPDDQGRSADFPDDEQATIIAKLPANFQAGLSRAASALVTPPAGVPKPQVPAVAKRPSINPFARKGNPLPWLLGIVILIGGGAYLAILASSRTAAKPAPAPSVTEEAQPQAKPAAPAVKKSPEVARDECIVSHFEQGALEAKADLAFVCEDNNFRETAARLHSMVKVIELADAGIDASSPDAAIAVDTLRSGARELDGGQVSALGWYELPATAIIRKACCPASTPITLPETPGWCDQLQTVVRRMADDSAKSVDLAPLARSFDKAVGCLFAQRVRHGYGYDRPPTAANRSSFQQFLGRAAIISTKR